jgi:hypothetical protein
MVSVLERSGAHERVRRQFRARDRQGSVGIQAREDIENLPQWRRSFSHLRKDSRYYEILEDTVPQEFEYKYFTLADAAGQVRSVQPFFILDQDLLAGSSFRESVLIRAIRRAWPRFLMMRTLMVGCTAGEGHLAAADPAAQKEDVVILARNATALARAERAGLIVFKEFPAHYRHSLSCLTQWGFARIPSMPMTRLDISAYSSFDNYLDKAFKSKRRNEFRRKLKAAQRLGKLELSVSTGASEAIEEIHSLYLQVLERAPLKFERLTAAFFRQIGQRMPDKARFFVWRLNGKVVGFSLCLIEGDTLFGEYLGLDYNIAIELNLYFKIMSDTISWAIANGFKAIASTGLSYEPKLHMHHRLMPLDLYVRHMSPLANLILRPLLRLLEPAKGEPVLKRFPNYDELYS